MTVSRTCPACGYTADYASARVADAHHRRHSCGKHRRGLEQARRRAQRLQDRKSTRLNSSHMSISYAVFCLKKKTITSIKEVNQWCAATAYCVYWPASS